MQLTPPLVNLISPYTQRGFGINNFFINLKKKLLVVGAHSACEGERQHLVCELICPMPGVKETTLHGQVVDDIERTVSPPLKARSLDLFICLINLRTVAVTCRVSGRYAFGTDYYPILTAINPE